MLESGKPTLLLSTQEGPRLGEGMRTAARKASQGREGLTLFGSKLGVSQWKETLEGGCLG